MSGTLSIGDKTVLSHDTNTDVVTLAHDMVTGTSSYGFIQLKMTSDQPISGDNEVQWDTLSGDITNYSQVESYKINLGIAGVYLITCSASFELSDNEQYVNIDLRDNTGTSLANAFDSIVQTESATTYSGVSINYTAHFDANSKIYFRASSAAGGNATLDRRTHASIVLLNRTA